MDYENDIKIDETALDIEWLEQPSLMVKYTRHAALMKAKADRAKERVDFVKAELDKDIRMNPEEYDIAKLTETTVLNTILVQKDYTEATEEYIEARFQQSVATGVVSGIEQRKSALEQLVKLHGLQYFAGPSIPRDLTKEWERKEKQKKSNEAVGEKMTRRKKS